MDILQDLISCAESLSLPDRQGNLSTSPALTSGETQR
jgi:hypothetical protein